MKDAFLYAYQIFLVNCRKPFIQLERNTHMTNKPLQWLALLAMLGVLLPVFQTSVFAQDPTPQPIDSGYNDPIQSSPELSVDSWQSNANHRLYLPSIGMQGVDNQESADDNVLWAMYNGVEYNLSELMDTRVVHCAEFVGTSDQVTRVSSVCYDTQLETQAYTKMSRVNLGLDNRMTSEKMECIIFEHANYGGSSYVFWSGKDYNSLDRIRWNDKASSMRCTGRAAAMLYEHENFTGRSIQLSSDVPNLHKFAIGGGWNRDWGDKASSIWLINY